MKKTKIFILSAIILILSMNVVSFADYNYDGEELSGKEQMKKILEVKDEKGKIVIPAYITGYTGSELIDEEEYIKKYEPIFNRYHEREDVVREFIKIHKEIENDKSDVYSNLATKRVLCISIFIIFTVIFIVLSFKISNSKILFFEIPLLIICLLLFPKNKGGNKIHNNPNAIIDYLSGKILNTQLDNFANEYKKNYLDKYNEREVDLSKVINDYIIKCYYCVKRRANNKELYTSDLEVLNCFEDEIHKYDFTYEQRYVDTSDWYSIDNWKVVNNLLSKESMKGIYDSISDEDIENFNKGTFLDELVKKLDKKIKSKDDFDAYSIVPYGYFNIIRLDKEPLYYCKYWYLDKGQDILIEFPYGVTLNYSIAKFESKDIEEYLNAEIRKLKYDPTDEKTLFLYYIDSSDKEQGIWTTVYKNSNYNKHELIDNIVLSSISVYTNFLNTESNSSDRASIKEDTDSVEELYIYFASRIKSIDKRNEDMFTKKFLDNYKKNGIMPDYNVSSVTDITKQCIDESKRLNNKIFCKVSSHTIANDIYTIFLLKWSDDRIDDIEYYIVPEDKMNLSYEEMYQLAFNE